VNQTDERVTTKHLEVDVIEEYLTGVRLNVEARLAVELHLMACQTCRDIYAETAEFVKEMRAVLTVQSGPG
jgi:predicted anti-sigma-YlaC factor YlaD